MNDLILQKSAQLKKISLNLHTICQSLGILLLPQNFGTEVDAIKGFYMKNSGIKSITYNCDMPKIMQEIVIAHELGHAMLHDRSALCTFHDIDFYHSTSKCEHEANLFAAEFLLDDAEVIEKVKEGTSFFYLAAQLGIPEELLCYKIEILKKKGYQLEDLPVVYKSRWLFHFKINENTCWDVASAKVSI